MKRMLVTVIVIIAVFIAYFIFVNRNNEEESVKKKPKIQVKVDRVKRGSIELKHKVTGTVEPYHIASLASPAEGPVVRLDVREGDEVHKGESLAVIGRNQSILALIQSYKESLKKEQSNLERTETLVRNNALPQEKLEQARSSYEKVKADMARAVENAEDHIIKAPWDGVVYEIFVNEGEYVSPRQNIVRIYDKNTLVIKSAVYESYAMQISEGLPVSIRLDAYSGEEFSGRITRVYPYLTKRLKTRPFEVEIPREISALPGMFARLALILKTQEESLLIPSQAVLESAKGESYVFVAEEGKAITKSVETGIKDGDLIQIIRGLSVGDTVVVQGMESLKDKSAIMVIGKENSGNKR